MLLCGGEGDAELREVGGRYAGDPPRLPEGLVPAADPLDRKLQLYNPLDDTRRLKAAPESFEQLRGNYPLRRERWD